MNETPIEVVKYDPEWSRLFERERERVLDAAGEHVERVFHIGSTAVPGLAAKPVVDLCPVASDFEEAKTCADALEEAGYDFGHETDDWIHLGRTAGDGQQFNVHVRPADSPEWRKNLLLREYLHENPDAREEYERIKRRAAEEYTDDIVAYSEAKTTFIEDVLDAAREKGFEERIPSLASNYSSICKS
jgi:GrpB-like predicted nucleotidyltransferase (UPF0157 family)